MNFRTDLHCHSNYSDGTCSPEEILILAKEKNLQGLSITDHDTMGAYSQKFFDLAKELELQVIMGVEISSQLYGESVHVLAYKERIDFSFNNFLKEIQKMRIHRNLLILEKLKKHNVIVSEEDLISEKQSDQSVIGRPHIAAALVRKGYTKNIKQSFDQYLNTKACCYVEGEKFSTSEVIDAIHKVNAKAIIAHPHIIKNKKVMSKLLTLPFDGLEGYYAMIFFSIEKKWIQKAHERNWIITGGSDFHGDVTPHISLGCSWVNEEMFEKLK